MKRIAMITMVMLFVLLMSANMGLAGTIGDVNGDGQVGLTEAVYALQVTAGVRTSAVIPSINYLDYVPQENGEYTYRYTSVPAAAGQLPSAVSFSYARGSVDGRDVLIETVSASPQKTYYAITPSQFQMLGYYAWSAQTPANMWFTPPVVHGSSSMSVGEFWINFYHDPTATMMYTRDFTLLGTEDVTVPAGTFTNCIKVLRRDYTTSLTQHLYSYCKNVGWVKRITQYAGLSGQIVELIGANVNGTSYPSPSAYRTCQGSWAKTTGGNTVATGIFKFAFNALERPIYSSLVLNNYTPEAAMKMRVIPIKSNDGEAFADYSPVCPEPCTFTPTASLAINGGAVTGTWIYTDAAINYIVFLNGNCSQ